MDRILTSGPRQREQGERVAVTGLMESTLMDASHNTGLVGTQAMDTAQMFAGLSSALTSGLIGPLAELLKASGVAAAKRKREQEKEDGPEEPVLVNVQNHHLLDNAHDVVDMKARSLRPFMGDQKDLFKNLPRKSRPVLQDLKDDHLTRSAVSSKLIEKLHDRGAELVLKMFHFKNVSFN